MSTVSVDQRFALLAAIGANANWDSLSTEEAQLGIVEAQRAGSEFTIFVKNGFRLQTGNFFRKLENFTIPIPALPRPTLEELKARFDWIKEIESDSSPTEAVVMELGTVLRTEEPSIKGKEYEFRLGSDSYLGLQHALWLVGHQDEFPEFAALLGEVYIDLPGLKVVASDGYRFFPYLRGGGGRWGLRWRWFGLVSDRDDRVARPCK